MSNEHTPGPWEAIGNLVRSPMHQPEGLPRGAQIADCRDGYFLTGTDEAKANARLIAAAPEMLESLKYVKSRIEDMPQYAELTLEEEERIGGDAAELSYLARICGEAIAKAEGGAA